MAAEGPFGEDTVSYSLLVEWASLAARWVHVIAAMAWIGTSFYFIALDASLRRREGLPAGVFGEAWQVHGGGFYRMMKYTVAPPELPERLTWFVSEAYTTWMSGFSLMLLHYYWNAGLLLVDPAVLDLPAWMAILLSLIVLAGGYGVYELLCRSPLARHDGWLALAGSLAVIVLAFVLQHVFSGRAALFHLGALLGTCMAANVAHVIIPNQRRAVAALREGREPDPALGQQAKQRSLHNNYLTLPVVFFMIANHYPLTFATGRIWLVALLVLVCGFSIRYFFNSRHAGKGSPWWSWAVAALAFALLAWIAAPQAEAAAEGSAPPGESDAETGTDIVLTRCAVCHAEEPAWEGIVVAPKGVLLDTPERIRLHAGQIRLQSVWSRAMPPANATGMTEAERSQLGRWLRKVAKP